MYKKLLESADIEWMAIFPLLLFTIFFVGIVVIALRRKQTFIDKMANMPLEEDEDSSNNSDESEI